VNLLTGLITMSRFYRLNSAIFLVIAGALVAEPDAGALLIAGPVVCVFLAGASMNILNDVLDKKGDELTNPRKPLVAGTVQVWQALATIVVLVVVALLVAALVVETPRAYIVTLGLYGGVIVCGYLYARLKRYGWLGPLISAVPGGFLGLIGYVMVGGTGLPALLVFVAVYGIVRGLANNLLASLQDVDTDPKAGTLTVAVQLGAPKTLLLAVVMNGLLIAAVVGIASYNDELLPALPIALFAALVLVVTSLSSIRTSSEAGRGRDQRQKDQFWYNQSRMITETALVAAFSPLLGVVAGLVLQGLWAGGTLYERWTAKGEQGQPAAASIPGPGAADVAPQGGEAHP
jgi:4-hydroxybenzoate polyprenyltransferase